MTGTAIVARRAAVVRASENRDAANGHDAIFREVLGDGILDGQFGAIHLHGRQELAVGELGQTLGLAADADEILDVIVPRSNVLVANGPVDSDTLAQIGFEVQVAPAIALAAPHDGAPADMTAANPEKGLTGIGGVGVFEVVDEKLVRVLVADAVTLALDRLRFQPLFAIVPAAVLQLPRGHVFDIVLLGNDGAARFEDKRL